MAIKVTANKTTPVVSTSVSTTARRTSVSSISTNSKTQTSATLAGLEGVDTTGVENGYTLVYDATSGNWEAAPASDVAANILNIDGGTF